MAGNKCLYSFISTTSIT